MSPMVKTPLTIEHALLGFIHRQPMHGYELQQQLLNAGGLGMVWRLKTSQLYALLGKLEHAGYLAYTLEPQELRPPRKIFHLTQAGETAFLDWVSMPVKQGRAIRFEFMAKLYFARQISPQTLSVLISRQQAVSSGWYEKLQAQIQACPAADNFQSWVLQFRLKQIEATLAWLETCRSSTQL